MRGRRGLTLVEALVTVAIVAVIALFAACLLWRLEAAREEARVIRCRWNLNHLGKGMATYLNEHGGNRFYPYPMGQGTRPDTFNGAEWLAALYWSEVTPDPDLFICPSSPDPPHGGTAFGAHRAGPAFGSQTVSYAAMHHRSGSFPQDPARGRAVTVGPADWRVATDASGKVAAGALRDDFPPSLPMASDDTQGAINHGKGHNGGMAVAFFDSHVEFIGNSEIDVQRGVGTPGSLLWQLRN